MVRQDLPAVSKRSAAIANVQPLTPLSQQGPTAVPRAVSSKPTFSTFGKVLVNARAASTHQPPPALGQWLGPASTNGRESFKVTRTFASCASAATSGWGTTHSPTVPTLAPGKGSLVSNMPMVGSPTGKGETSIVHAATRTRHPPVTLNGV